MNEDKEIFKVLPDRKQRLKDHMKHQLTASGTFNLEKVVNTFGADNHILKEAVLEWATEGIARMKATTPKTEAEETFIKMFDGIYADVWFQKYWCAIFFFKGNPSSPECWFRLENLTLWCDVERGWAIFKDEYSMKFADIQDLMRYMVEEAFRLRGVIVRTRGSLITPNWMKHPRLRGLHQAPPTKKF